MDASYQRKLGSLIGYVYTICQAVISIVYIPILLHGIGDSEYGLYQILSSVIAYFAAMEAPLSASLLRYYSFYKEEGNQKKMENTLAIGRRMFVLFSIAFIIISIPTAFIIKMVYAASLTPNELREALLMFGIMIVNLIINLYGYTYIAAITAFESFVFLKLSSLVTLIVQPILVIWVIRKLPYAFVIVLIATILSFALYWMRRYYAIHKLRVVIKYHEKDRELVFGIVKLSLSVLFVAIADQIFWKTDQLILGAICNTKTVSIYSIGSQINSMFISVACVLGGMTLPMVTRVSTGADADQKLSEMFTKIGRYQSYLVFLILTGVILFGREFIIILSGPEYLDTYYVALLLMIPYSVDLIQTCAGSILQVKDKYYLRSIILFIVAVINIALTLLFTRKYGMIGAAMATTISIIVSNVLLNIFYQKLIKLDITLFWKKNIPIILSSAVICGLGYFISCINISNIYIAFAVHIFVYSVMYSVLMYSFVMNKQEKALIQSIIWKMVGRGKETRPC